jgi:hypothetical protein
VEVTGPVIVDPGVTLTVGAGTTVTVDQAGELKVYGSLTAMGTSASIVTIQPATGNAHFGPADSGVTVGDGTNPASLTYTFVKHWGSSLVVAAGSTATITDSRMSQALGDFLITAPNSTVTMKYSAIGLEPGAGTDTTHCDTHFNGGTLTMVHSNLSTSSYGTMFYGGIGAKFMYDNWFGNTTNVSIQAGVNGDFSNGYFENTQPPTVAGITAGTLSPTRLVACDGTNNMTCAGPRPGI